MSLPYRAWAEVDLSALRENLTWIRHRVGPTSKIMTVVKADAYGHGLKPIAALLMQSGTDIFGVANLVEAHVIRSVGKGWPILMLGACVPDEFEFAVRDGVMVTLSTFNEAQQLAAVARKLNKPGLAHLKIDTGMARLGVPAEQAALLCEQIERLPGVSLQGIYTHFSSVEDDARYTRHQQRRFAEALQAITEKRTIPYIHANNSGGLLLEPGCVYNTVRPGLLVYGILPNGRRRIELSLAGNFRPALSWKCRVSLVKEVRPGTALSYGRSFVAKRKMRVATLTAGYGDGYLRAGSNRSQVLIRGRLCRIVGRITMDQMLADVSRVPDVTSGDEVVLIGRQGNAQVRANDLAEWFGTIPWEVLTNITYRVPRIYRGSNAA